MNNKKRTAILLTDVRSLEDQALFLHYLSRVNAERRREVEEEQFADDRYLSLGGGALLDRLLTEWGIRGEIRHDEQGKPVVDRRPELYVSLTHAYPYAAAMISDAPCGLDIERRDRELEAVARRYYNEREKHYAGGDQDRITDVWCRKECVIKCWGPRDVREIDTFAIPPDHEYVSIPLPGYSFEVLKKKGSYLFRNVLLDMDW